MFSSPMLLDFNNSSKRSKITKACDNCRRRRVKCDGVPDGCGGCKAAKTQCVYTTSTTKRGPPKGYVEVIEDRLGKIENMLAGIVKRKALVPRDSTDKAASQSEGEDNNDDDDHASLHSSDLVEVKKQPPASPVLRPERSCTPAGFSARSGSISAPLGRHSPLVSRNLSLTSLLPFSQEQHHFAAQQGYPSSVTHADMTALTNMFDKLGTTSVRTTVPFPWLAPEQSRQYGRNYLQFSAQSLEPPLPILARPFPPTTSPDVTIRLLNSFFDHFNAFLPIIHRPTFMKQWQRQSCQFCTPASAQSKQQQPQSNAETHQEQHLADPVAPLSPLLLNAVLAVASRVPAMNQGSDACQKAAALSQSFFDAARVLLDEFLDVPRVSTVQALCLMSQFHHQGQWKATRSSSYLSMAIRMAHELGLNHDPEMICGPDADALRYLWWSMFILDHQFSAWLGLGLLMQGKESDVELPMDVSSSPLEHRGFICLVRLVKILGTVLQHSYSTQSLPPQFGGHDSMVSYIEGSLTSWLSNLAPDMRWQNPNGPGTWRGSPASPMRSPLQQSIILDAKRVLAKENSEIYPAYLHIVYNTTLILLHRPYIVGAAGSPAAAQSNTICTGSGRAITDIAQGLDMEHCSYTVNRFALFALLQAGVIHAMNAVYDKRGSEVAMGYYKRTLHVLEGFLACAAYSGGVAEGIKHLEQFLASTAMAAGEEGESHAATEMCSMEQDEGQPNRKKRQLDTQVSQSSIHSYNSATSVQYRGQSSAHDLPTSSAAFVQPTVLTQTSLPMMMPSELATIQTQPVYVHNAQQQKQPHPVDLKEQQKQQQLKIQQQHRMYQQLHTFGAGAAKDLRMNNEQQKLEQQQQQQQQLLKQQLQRQQHKQQLELEMKEQNAGVNATSLQTSTPSTTGATAPVIPSHRYALQMLQQQQQHQFLPHSSMSMPMTMTMATLTMEAQNKVNQDFEMNNLTVASSAGYDPTTFWVDFSASDQSSSSAGTINPAGLEQDALRISTVESQNQFGGTPLWM
ncbi:MAG: fungal-specific transcription factor domain-containing protein [Benniella sp.]|nr:MAG: fungal-specific transcription factor domain-containing protein [Benniella sp.]